MFQQGHTAKVKCISINSALNISFF